MSVIDDHFAKLTPAQKAGLQRVRNIAMTVTPDAEDTIGYGMPVLKYKKKYLLGFDAFKDHLSIFPGSEAIADFSNELKTFKTAKGTVQFTPENPIPDELLIKIVTHRKKAIDK